jgi:hypothetical protein
VLTALRPSVAGIVGEHIDCLFAHPDTPMAEMPFW